MHWAHICIELFLGIVNFIEIMPLDVRIILMNFINILNCFYDDVTEVIFNICDVLY